MKDRCNEKHSFFRRLLALILCLMCFFSMTTFSGKIVRADDAENPETVSVSDNVGDTEAQSDESNINAASEQSDESNINAVANDYWGGGGSSSSGYTFTVDPTLNNTEMIYFAYHSSSDVTDSVNFQTATSGQTITLNNFNSNSQAGYVVFFVKPNSNYLLVGAGATGNNDIYSIDGNKGNISSYPSIAKLVSQAKELGYVGVLGYMRAAQNNSGMSQSLEITSQSPDITVSATPDKKSGVKPNDVVNFTISITPGKTTRGLETVQGVNATSLTINGNVIDTSSLTWTKDSSGNYTATVAYTASQADCASGTVELNVEAEVTYSCKLNVSDDQSIGSTAVITKSASTSCDIAPKNRIVYHVSHEGDYASYPSDIDQVPYDTAEHYAGDTVAVDNTYGTAAVEDKTNGGEWTFDGWYTSEDLDPDTKVTSVVMGNDTINLYGKWTFQAKYVDLTVTKLVTGNIGDRSKEFAFSITIGGETKNFTLKHGESQVFQVPIGSIVSVSEDAESESGYTTSYQIGDGEKVEASSASVTVGTDNMSLTFTNDKETVIDTGIFDNPVPYYVILGVTASFAAWMLLKKKTH